MQGKGTRLRTNMGQMRADPVVQSLTIVKGSSPLALEQQKEGEGHSADGERGIQGPMDKSGLGIIMGQQRSGPLELGIRERVNASIMGLQQ